MCVSSSWKGRYIQKSIKIVGRRAPCVLKPDLNFEITVYDWISQQRGMSWANPSTLRGSHSFVGHSRLFACRVRLNLCSRCLISGVFAGRFSQAIARSAAALARLSNRIVNFYHFMHLSKDRKSCQRK